MSERALAAEVMVAWALQAADSISQGDLPPPAKLLGSLVVFVLLSVFALIGDSEARLAGRFGALVLLVIVIAPADPKQPYGPGNEALAVRIIQWLSNLGATTTPAGSGQPAASSSGTPQKSTIGQSIISSLRQSVNNLAINQLLTPPTSQPTTPAGAQGLPGVLAPVHQGP